MIDKLTNRIFYFILIALSTQLVYTSCKEEEELVYITLSGSKALDLGESSQFTVLIDATDGSLVNAPVKWESLQPEVATVDPNGLVKSLTVGIATIRASLPNGKNATVEITVSQPAGILIPILDYYFVSDGIDPDTTITANLKPEMLSGAAKIVWTSSDPEVAEIVSIDTLETMRKELKSYAVFRPKKKGTALITVSNANKRREFYIHVGTVVNKIGWYLQNNQPVTISKSFTLNLGTDSLLTGYYAFRSADVANGWKDLDFKWSIQEGKENILEAVGEPTILDGIAAFHVRAKSEGKAKIMLNVAGLSLTATCQVRDIAKINVDSITLKQTVARQNAGGFLLLLEAVAYPKGVVAAWPISWSSSDPTVATVNQLGEVITGNKSGKVIITAVSKDKRATCEVTVFQMIDKLFISNSSSTTVMVGNQEFWQVTPSPIAAEVKNLKWKSDNESVAKVSDQGIVTAVGKGKTFITASCMTETEIEGELKEIVSIPRQINVMPLQGNMILTETDWWDEGEDNYCMFDPVTRAFKFNINYEPVTYAFTATLAEGITYVDGTYTIGSDLKNGILTWTNDTLSGVETKVTAGTIKVTHQNEKVRIEMNLTLTVGDKTLSVKAITPYFESER